MALVVGPAPPCAVLWLGAGPAAVYAEAHFLLNVAAHCPASAVVTADPGAGRASRWSLPCPPPALHRNPQFPCAACSGLNPGFCGQSSTQGRLELLVVFLVFKTDTHQKELGRTDSAAFYEPCWATCATIQCHPQISAP